MLICYSHLSLPNRQFGSGILLDNRLSVFFVQTFSIHCFTTTSSVFSILQSHGAPDKPCGVGCADVNPKTVAKRYMIVQKVVSLHYESEWQ